MACPLVWDKAPNKFGQKTIVIDSKGMVVDHTQAYEHTAASIGSHLLRLAILQGIIRQEDILKLPIGKAFTLKDLVERRNQNGHDSSKLKPGDVDEL